MTIKLGRIPSALPNNRFEIIRMDTKKVVGYIQGPSQVKGGHWVARIFGAQPLPASTLAEVHSASETLYNRLFG